MCVRACMCVSVRACACVSGCVYVCICVYANTVCAGLSMYLSVSPPPRARSLPPLPPICLRPTTIPRSPDQEAIARLVLALRHVFQMSLQSLLGYFYVFIILYDFFIIFFSNFLINSLSFIQNLSSVHTDASALHNTNTHRPAVTGTPRRVDRLTTYIGPCRVNMPMIHVTHVRLSRGRRGSVWEGGG